MAILKNIFRVALARIFVISDTHFGAPYADAADGERVLQEGLEGYWRIGPKGEKIWVDHPATCCVLLGDNYELVNLPLKREPETILKYSRAIDRHIDHLRKLIKEHPGCKFIFVKGNHERLPEFDVALDQLFKELEEDELWRGHLEIQTHFKKIGDGLLVHGDQSRSPKKYHVNEEHPNDYSNFDKRYDESYVELHRAAWYQSIHDIGNRILPWPLGRLINHPRLCAHKILDWAHDRFLLNGVNHVFSAHTHDPITDLRLADPNTVDFDALSEVGMSPILATRALNPEKSFRHDDPQTCDPETGKPKTFHFYNAGASIYTLGWKLIGGRDRINRHCFNALSLFLNSDNFEDPDVKITEVISFKWPQFNWKSEDRPPDIRDGPWRVPEILPLKERETVPEEEPVYLRAGSSDPSRRNRIARFFFEKLHSPRGPPHIIERTI